AMERGGRRPDAGNKDPPRVGPRRALQDHNYGNSQPQSIDNRRRRQQQAAGYGSGGVREEFGMFDGSLFKDDKIAPGVQQHSQLQESTVAGGGGATTRQLQPQPGENRPPTPFPNDKPTPSKRRHSVRRRGAMPSNNQTAMKTEEEEEEGQRHARYPFDPNMDDEFEEEPDPPLGEGLVPAVPQGGCNTMKPRHWTYSSMIGLALLRSADGELPVSRIYPFIRQHFRYFSTDTSNWMNRIRHNVCTVKWFRKVETTAPGNGRKRTSYAIRHESIEKVRNKIRRAHAYDGHLVATGGQ
ncbi:hypothetical protein PFISCL1PPCAC_206, partial [Pristionchus fissidentatus]